MKRIGYLLLFTVMICAVSNMVYAEQPENGIDDSDSQVSQDDELQEFDKNYIFFMDEKYPCKNYICSPLASRAGVCLMIAATAGETKDQLLRAAGFSSDVDMESWYHILINTIDEFDESFSKMEREFQLAEDGTGTTGRAFILANSVWVNNAYRVFMKDEYKKYTERIFGATAEEEDKGYITEAINNWFTVKTHGFMEEMGTNFSNSCTVFADVLYVKACWKDRFYDHEIENGVFNTINRDEVQKQFMCRKEEFLYYEGEDGKAIIVPLEGGLLFVAALGKRIDIDKHIKNKDFSDEVVILRIPKMNIDTSVDNSAIMEFLKSRGATDVFDRQKADFSPMKEESSDPVYIDSIVQRAKLNMDEYGIEASAGEVMLAAVGAGGYIPREPKEFIADKPFSFALYYNTYMDEEPKMLYYGRYVE